MPLHMPLNSLGVILLLANWLFLGVFVVDWSKLRNNKLFWVLVSFYLLHVIGLLYTKNIEDGGFDVQLKLALLILPLIMLTSKPLAKKQINYLVQGFIGACLGAMTISLINATIKYINTKSDSSVFFNEKLTGLLDFHPTYFGLYLTFCLIIVMQYIISNFDVLSGIKKVGLLVLSFSFTVFVLLLSSRMALVVMLVIWGWSLIYYLKKYKKIYVFTGILILLVGGGIVILKKYPINVLVEKSNLKNIMEFEPRTNKNKHTRLDIWQYSIYNIQDNWLLGVGTGDTQDVLNKSYLPVHQWFAEREFNSHNQFLQFTLALGALGLLGFVASLYFAYAHARLTKNSLYKLFLVLIILFCFTESILVRQKGLIFYAFFNSVFAFTYLAPADKKQSTIA